MARTTPASRAWPVHGRHGLGLSGPSPAGPAGPGLSRTGPRRSEPRHPSSESITGSRGSGPRALVASRPQRPCGRRRRGVCRVRRVGGHVGVACRSRGLSVAVWLTSAADVRPDPRAGSADPARVKFPRSCHGLQLLHSHHIILPVDVAISPQQLSTKFAISQGAMRL